MPKPKILEAVTEMMAQGLSDEEIVENLRSVGLSDDQIKKVMSSAHKDVYARFKREMSGFVKKKLEENQPLIDRMVEKSIEKKSGEMKEKLSAETQEIVGDLAKEVNQKTRDMEMAVKKVREENLKLRKTLKLNRADIDLLLGGPAKIRFWLSLFFLFVGIILLIYGIFMFSPPIVNLIVNNQIPEAAILTVQFAALAGASVALMTVGVYFSGRPGRQ